MEVEDPAGAAMEWTEQAHPGAPVLVGLVVESEGYAVALALPFGYPLQHLFLRRREGVWEVISKDTA